MDAGLEGFADVRRPWIEKELGLDKMPKFAVSDPWHMPFYKKPEMESLRLDGTIPYSFKTKNIKIETYAYKEDYKEFYDVLSYRQDELGNLLAKEWDRQITETITLKEEDMDRSTRKELNWKMGYINKLEDIVVYFRNINITLEESSNKDMWYVEEINKSYSEATDSVILRSITRDNHKFETRKSNILLVEHLEEYNLINDNLFSDKALNAYRGKLAGTKKYNTTEEENTMAYSTKNGNMVKRTTDANVSAAKVAATITAGKTLNALVANKITPQLPFMVKVYADTAIGRVVIANLADFSVKQFMGTNQKANMATEAMMQAAMLELADSFDLEGIVSELVDSVVLDIPEAEKE